MIGLMHDRFARALITRLALLTSVIVLSGASPAAAAKNPDETISEITDNRIQESSGLALSVKHDDLVYTMNDEGGSGAKVYAVQVSTGEVVGATDVSALPLEDPESMAVDADGTLWLGDLGDNDHQRDDAAIYAFPEPGPGEHRVSGTDRYPIALPGGPQDVEGLMVHPQTRRVYIVSKNEDGNGQIFELPDLTAGGTVQARAVGEAPTGVTDASFTHSGQWAVLRTEEGLWLYDPTSWEAVGHVETPKLEQGESVTVEQGDQTVLLGSEGRNSPLVRVALPAASGPVSIDSAGKDGDDDDEGSTVKNSLELAIPLGLVAAALLVGGILAQRRMKI